MPKTEPVLEKTFKSASNVLQQMFYYFSAMLLTNYVGKKKSKYIPENFAHKLPLQMRCATPYVLPHHLI